MAEQFQQQQNEMQSQIQEQSQKFFEEYKRDCDVAAQLTVHTASQEFKRDCDTAAQLNLEALIRNNKTAVEEEYTRKAVEYRNFLKWENESDKAALIVMLESHRSENLFLNGQNGQGRNML